MSKWQVIFQLPDHFEWLGFICDADDAEHAEEQCVNAYPDCDVLWVSLSNSEEMDWTVMGGNDD